MINCPLVAYTGGRFSCKVIPRVRRGVLLYKKKA